MPSSFFLSAISSAVSPSRLRALGAAPCFDFTREGRGIRIAGGEQQPRVDAQVLLAGDGRRGDAEERRRRQGKRRHQDVPERHVRSPP